MDLCYATAEKVCAGVASKRAHVVVLATQHKGAC